VQRLGAARAQTVIEDVHECLGDVGRLESLVVAVPMGNPVQRSGERKRSHLRIARRDRLIVLLLYGCGLRTSELCALDVADINRERHELVVLKAKGDRPRSIPIPEALYTELLAYLLEHGKRGALFRTHHRARRIRDHDVCEIVTAAAERAGLRAGVTARTLRHSFATHLMDRGVDLAIIASLMGHRSPQETGVYLHVLPQRPEAAVRTLPIGVPR